MIIYLVFILAGSFDFWFKERLIASLDYNWNMFYKEYPFMKDGWSFCIYGFEAMLIAYISWYSGNWIYMFGLLTTLNEDMLYYAGRIIFFHKKCYNEDTVLGGLKKCIAGRFYYPFNFSTKFTVAVILWVLSNAMYLFVLLK